MSNFIQSLESRRFFSATASTLLGDKAAVVADAGLVKTALNALIVSNSADAKIIAADFKGLPKGDLALLKTLLTSEVKAKAVFLKTTGLLDTTAVSASTKSVAAGDAVLKKATTGSLAILAKDIAALDSVTTVPLSNLQNALAATTVNDARSAILTALPDDTALDAVVSSNQTSAIDDKATIGADAVQLQADVAVLANDLESIHTVLGTFPNAIGTYSGTATLTSGKGLGQTQQITLVIVSEDGNGTLTGTVTNFAGGVTALKGTITLNGVVVLKALPGNSAITLDGSFSGTTVAGTFLFLGGKGTFAVSQ